MKNLLYIAVSFIGSELGIYVLFFVFKLPRLLKDGLSGLSRNRPLDYDLKHRKKRQKTGELRLKPSSGFHLCEGLPGESYV